MNKKTNVTYWIYHVNQIPFTFQVNEYIELTMVSVDHHAQGKYVIVIAIKLTVKTVHIPQRYKKMKGINN